MTEVGCSWGGTSDVRPSYFDLLNLELHEESSRTSGAQARSWAGIQLGLQANACNRRAAVETDAVWRAAIEVLFVGRKLVLFVGSKCSNFAKISTHKIMYILLTTTQYILSLKNPLVYPVTQAYFLSHLQRTSTADALADT